MNNFFKNIFCLLFSITIFVNIFPMQYLQNSLRRRNNLSGTSSNKLEAGVLYESSENNNNSDFPILTEIIIGNFEDHQLAAQETLKNIVPGKIFPEEIWREIIQYLDFNDPALIRFFAPIMGVTKEQAEKIAFAIHYSVVKNASNFEDIDLKLKSILRTYNKKSQELIKNYITLLDLNFDQEYKNLKYTVGLIPIRWLLSGPSKVRDDIKNLQKENIAKILRYQGVIADDVGLSGEGKPGLKDIANMKKFYSKLKKRELMYKYFGSEKYNKILERYRENFVTYFFCIFFTHLTFWVLSVATFAGGSLDLSLIWIPAILMYYIVWHAFFVVLDKESLSDNVKHLEGAPDYIQSLMEYLNKKLAEDRLLNAAKKN